MPADHTPRSPSSLPEILFSAATKAAGLFILTLVGLLVLVLVLDAYPALKRASEFQLFTSQNWIPKPADPGNGLPKPPPTFGSLAFIYGTVITSILAMAIAVPLGVASAAFLSEIATPTIRRVGAFLIELLAAIPSVVYGFWGVFVLAPVVQLLFNQIGGPNTGGNGILSAGIILAVMILPYITAISFDVCQAVPRSQREGSLALGATRWQTIWSVVLPYARPGIIAASFLALGRALGETMAVTMLIGNQAVIEMSPFALGDTISSRIANQLNEADEVEFRSALIALALVLLFVTAGFNILARFLLTKLTSGPKVRMTAPKPLTDDGIDRSGMPAVVLPQYEGVSARPRIVSRFMVTTLYGCFILTVVPLFLILGYITYRGTAALEVSLFLERARPALTDAVFLQYKQAKATGAPMPLDDFDRPIRRGGVGHAMIGSAMIVSLATLFAVPIGLLAAVYLSEARRSRIAKIIRFVTELLGGVPSIVIGIFGYSLLVYPFWLGGKPWGYSGVAGAVTLAIMMIPIVVRSAEESMKLVPDSLREASYALGANRMQTILRVVLPASLPAIVTGVFLAISRIAGETAPLLLTAGNIDRWPGSPTGQTPYLPYYIFNYSRGQFLDQQEQAWAATLVLLVVVMLLNIGTRLLAGKRVVAASRAA